MGAAWPAARATFAFFEIFVGLFEAFRAGFVFLRGGDPANPFVARKGCNILPRGAHGWVRGDAVADIAWQVVDDTAENGCRSFSHKITIAPLRRTRHNIPHGFNHLDAPRPAAS